MDDNRLEELARQERLEYFRRWRAANKDRVRASNQRYWKRKAQKKLDEQASKKES